MAKKGLRITILDGKVPRLNSWTESATTSLDQVVRWDEQFPGANFGCVFKKGEFWGLDEDVAGVIDRFTNETGITVSTFRVQSSAGRYHWRFKANADSDARLRNITQINFKDQAASVRFNNEQCVCPFSVHPEKHTQYLPVDMDATIQEAPTELISWILDQQVQASKPSAQSATEPRMKIQKGGRDTYLFTRAATLRSNGLDQKEIEAVILRENEELCVPPVDQEQALKCARQGARYEKGDPTPTMTIGGKLPGEAPVPPKQSQTSQEQPIEIIPKPAFRNPTKVIKSLAEYPRWVYEGTIFDDFAELCGKDNFIPHEFFVESLKTIIGAICGHRIQLAGARGQQPSRFYTIVIAPPGIGKSTAGNWAQEMLTGTGLLYEQSQQGAFMNIGCALGTFGSDVGMKKGFLKHSRILQIYDEASSLIEKFGITGSGGPFLDVTDQLYEYTHSYPQMGIKTDKELPVAPEFNNSILGYTTPVRWKNAFLRTHLDGSGFLQRLNIVANKSKKRKTKVFPPDLTGLRDDIVRRIQCLEYQMAEVTMTDEASKMFDDWLEAKEATEEWQSLPEEITGRLTVLIQRNSATLAFFMSGDPIIPNAEKAKEPIQIVCDEDIMTRAIALAEYELRVRQLYRPPEGNNEYALMECAIELHFAEMVQNGEAPEISRNKLFKDLNACRIGITVFDKCVNNLVQEGKLKVGKYEGETRRGRKAQVLTWIGDE